MSEIIITDPLRESVEAASGGAQTVLWTKSGFPTYMNVIPRFNLEDLHPSLGIGPHPAFVVNGVVKERIFIGTYQAVLQGGEAISLPWQDPERNINFDAARQACLNAGPGFHLMTNWEWAAIALWCAAKGIDVRGNTNQGRSHSHPNEMGTKVDGSSRTLTGSGPDSWRHDGTPFGISDLVGNVWEWVDGLKLVGGRILMPVGNNFALDESEWPDTGACIDLVAGSPIISDEITTQGWNGAYFKNVGHYFPLGTPVTLQQALLCTGPAAAPPGYYWANNRNNLEALPIRGGGWSNGSDAGLAALGLSYVRSLAYSVLGFRPAFIE